MKLSISLNWSFQLNNYCYSLRDHCYKFNTEVFLVECMVLKQVLSYETVSATQLLMLYVFL